MQAVRDDTSHDAASHRAASHHAASHHAASHHAASHHAASHHAASHHAEGSPGGSDLVTLADAAELLDVHYMTAYRYVRTGRMVAEKRGGKWWVTTDALAAVLEEGTGPRRRPTPDNGPRDYRVEAFTGRLIAGDTSGCWDLISDLLTSGAPPSAMYSELLSVALADVGDRWSKGELNVADEHRATATAYRLIGQMGPLFRHRGRRRGSIILGSVSGDMHSLPTAMLTDLLADRRFEVIDLGANTPTESFIDAAAQVDDLLGFGVCVTVDDFVDVALEQAQGIRAAHPDDFLLLGGSPIAAAGRRDEFLAHVDAVSDDAVSACAAFDGLASASADK